MYMPTQTFAIASFRSRSAVQKFEQALRRRGVSCQIMSTPREVAIGCGLSVRFALADLSIARAELHAAAPGSFIGFYSVDLSSGRARVSPIR